MENEIPSSRNITTVEAKDYWLTAVEWNGDYGASYEVGIREKGGTQKFMLLQGSWNESQIGSVARACAILLDSGKFRPTDLIHEIFRQ